MIIGHMMPEQHQIVEGRKLAARAGGAADGGVRVGVRKSCLEVVGHVLS